MKDIAAKGYNAIFFDVADGYEYPSHRELAAKGAWSEAELMEALSVAREEGIEPIPYMDFVSSRNAWLGAENLPSASKNTAHFDEEAENAVRDVLASFGILCEVAVYRDLRGHKNIHLCGKDLDHVITDSQKFLPHFSTALKARLTAPIISHTESLDDIVIREQAPLRALFGAATKKRGDSEISGDSGSFFHPANGVCALLLSDGMGSGKLAACESATSIKLLEDLLKSEISPDRALRTLHTAFSLK